MNASTSIPIRALVQLSSSPIESVSFKIELAVPPDQLKLNGAEVKVKNQIVSVRRGTISYWERKILFGDRLGRQFCFSPQEVISITAMSGDIIWQNPTKDRAESLLGLQLATQSVS